MLLKSRWMQLFCSTCISFNPSFKKNPLETSIFSSASVATSLQVIVVLQVSNLMCCPCIGDFSKYQLGIFPTANWGFFPLLIGDFSQILRDFFPMVQGIFFQWFKGFFSNGSKKIDNTIRR